VRPINPLDLALGDGDAAGVGKVEASLGEAGFIGPLQADKPGEGGRVASFQTECCIRRAVAALFSGMVVASLRGLEAKIGYFQPSKARGPA
jgi:hypothetical protein